MVFFFALAAKEVFEATLPGGALASPRRALSPLAAAVGGMVAPALIYLALTSTRGPAELARGWAIPCATDIAFSAMVARIDLSARPSGHSVPAAARDRRRRARADHPRRLLSRRVALSLSALVALMVAAVLVASGCDAAATLSFWPYVIGPGCALVGGAVLRWLPSGPGTRADRAVHAAQPA